MEDAKLDPKAKWRAKNREKLNEYARQYWRKKQAAKGLAVADVGKKLPQDIVTDKQRKAIDTMILENIGANVNLIREASKKFIINLK